MELVLFIMLAVLSFIFLTTILNVFFWKKLTKDISKAEGKVSVLIPARNEASNIGQCLESIAEQKNVFEILVYDDHSTDGTAKIVDDYSKMYPFIKTLAPVELAVGWTGKNFACYQLASEAMGEWFLFIDADTRLTEEAIPRILAQAIESKATFLSCWPKLEMHSFWEKLLMPLLNFFVYSIYPAPISFKYKMPSLGIAHGACILMKSNIYKQVGGHSRVRNKIFEDTELARAWRIDGELSLCFDGQDVVQVRMYDSLKEIWQGFQKNFYPGFQSQFSFWMFIFLHTTLFLLPFFLFFLSPYILAMAIVVWLVRILLALRFKHPIWSALLHPITEIFLIILGISSWRKCKSGMGVIWKDRTYFSKS